MTTSSGRSERVLFFEYSAAEFSAPETKSLKRLRSGAAWPFLMPWAVSSSKTKVILPLGGTGSTSRAPSVSDEGALLSTPPSSNRPMAPFCILMSTGLKTGGRAAEACTAAATSMSGSVSALNTLSSGFLSLTFPGCSLGLGLSELPIMVPVMTASLMAGMIFERMRRSMKVAPPPPSNFLVISSRVFSIFGSILPLFFSLYSAICLPSADFMLLRTSSSRPLPSCPIGEMSLPLMTFSKSTLSLRSWKSCGVMPAASMAAVMEPTEAPCISLAWASTPDCASAQTAPGRAAPLPPPPEKVTSWMGGASWVNATRPSLDLTMLTFLPSGPVQTVGGPAGSGALMRAPGLPGPSLVSAGPTARVQTLGSAAALLTELSMALGPVPTFLPLGLAPGCGPRAGRGGAALRGRFPPAAMAKSPGLT